MEGSSSSEFVPAGEDVREWDGGIRRRGTLLR
jgi:hypothetical protein